MDLPLRYEKKKKKNPEMVLFFLPGISGVLKEFAFMGEDN